MGITAGIISFRYRVIYRRVGGLTCEPISTASPLSWELPAPVPSPSFRQRGLADLGQNRLRATLFAKVGEQMGDEAI